MAKTLNEKDREFYMNLLKIAIPVMLQQLIIVAVSLCDTIMVGKLSEEALAAVGSANQVFIVYIDSIFGLLSGIAVYSAQYWGIRDLKKFRQLMGMGYISVIVLGTIVTAVVYLKASFFVGIFNKDPMVIEMGTAYLKISVFTYLIGSLTFVISYNSRVVAMLKWPTIINATAVSINIFLNWVLIFGKFGAPAYGVSGAALATLIARIIELILMLTFVYVSKDNPLKATISELKFELDFYKRVMKTALPVIVNEVLWVVSFTAVFAVYGRISPAALAVVQVAMTLSDIFQSLYFGLGNGCTVLVGQALGQGKRELGHEYARRCLWITMALNVITTLSFILLRGPLVTIYDFEPATNELLYSTLLMYAIAITPKMYVYVFICGVFRPGGDTIWSAFIDSGINWAVQFPLAVISVCVLKLELPWCVLMVAGADLLKTIICLFRFRTNKWINVFTGR